jgi:protein phosphatase
MMWVESAGITDVGRRRENNEDRIFLDDEHGLYLVADGMGGHQAGEIASQLVVETLRDFIADNGAGGAESRPATAFSRPAERMLAGIRQSNRVVHAAAQANSRYHGMGSTVAAVWLTPENLIAANVGDSSIYLIRKGKIDLLSVPHTLQAESEDPVRAATVSNILTRAVGPRPEVEADLCELSCFRNDLLVLCSDGLSTKVAPWEILAIAAKRPAEVVCRSLVNLANERGGDDNISAVVVRVKRVRRYRLGCVTRWAHRLKRMLPRSRRN